jgi:hypothetical protein
MKTTTPDKVEIATVDLIGLIARIDLHGSPMPPENAKAA